MEKGIPFKEIIVPRFEYQSHYGVFIFHEFTVLVDVDSKLTGTLFDQETDDYYISDEEVSKHIKKMCIELMHDQAR